MPAIKRSDGSSFFAFSTLFMILALFFFTVAALEAGNVLSGLGPWLVPGGLASFTLAHLVP